jgi:hypothetical protein
MKDRDRNAGMQARHSAQERALRSFGSADFDFATSSSKRPRDLRISLT